MEKIVSIDGKEFRLVANGATPRKYRSLFTKDIFSGMTNAVSPTGEIKNSEFFENLTFCMAVQGGSIPEGTTIDQWLEQFSPMAIMTVAPEVLELWTADTETTSTGKKK